MRRIVQFGMLIVFALSLLACGTSTTGAVPDTTPIGDNSGARSTAAPAATASPSDPTAVGDASPAVTSRAGSVIDQVSLVDALRAAGATVDIGDTVEQPYLAVSGAIVQVNGQDVQVFEYADEQAASADAKNLADAVNGTGTVMVTWIAPPHAYQAGRVLVLYLGNDAMMLRLLEDRLGVPFAE